MRSAAHWTRWSCSVVRPPPRFTPSASRVDAHFTRTSTQRKTYLAHQKYYRPGSHGMRCRFRLGSHRVRRDFPVHVNQLRCVCEATQSQGRRARRNRPQGRSPLVPPLSGPPSPLVPPLLWSPLPTLPCSPIPDSPSPQPPWSPHSLLVPSPLVPHCLLVPSSLSPGPPSPLLPLLSFLWAPLSPGPPGRRLVAAPRGTSAAAL